MSSHAQLISKSMFNETVSAFLSRYRYSRVPLSSNNTSSINLTAGGTQTLQFKLPCNQPYNMSRSYIQYQYVIPQNGALFTNTFVSDVPFRTLTYGCAGGPNIVDLSIGADQYVATLGLFRSSLQEFQSRDVLEGFHPSGIVEALEFSESGTALNEIINNASPVSLDNLTTGTVFECSQSNGYLDLGNMIGWGSANVTVNKYFALSLVKDTFLSMNRNIASRVDMYLTLGSQYSNRIGFYSAVNKPSMVMSSGITTGWTPTPFTTVTMQNISLMLAIEQNPVLIQAVLKSLDEGRIKMLIPYSVIQRQNISANQSNIGLTFQIQGFTESRLKRIIYRFVHASESSQYSYWGNNINGAIMTNYKTFLNSIQETDDVIQCYNPNCKAYASGSSEFSGNTIFPPGINSTSFTDFGRDWIEIAPYLKGSCLQNYYHFQSNFFISSQYGCPALLDEINSEFPIMSNVVDGLNTGNSGQIINLQASCPSINQANNVYNSSGLICYLFLTYVRMMYMGPQGIVIGV